MYNHTISAHSNFSGPRLVGANTSRLYKTARACGGKQTMGDLCHQAVAHRENDIHERAEERTR